MRQRTVKAYGKRKIQPKNGSYAVISVPLQALQDEDMPVDRGDEVEVAGIVESDGETYLKLGGE